MIRTIKSIRGSPGPLPSAKQNMLIAITDETDKTKENRGKSNPETTPPSSGITGIRLKSARDRFSRGKTPNKNIARLKKGPERKITRLFLFDGTLDSESIQPKGRR